MYVIFGEYGQLNNKYSIVWEVIPDLATIARRFCCKTTRTVIFDNFFTPNSPTFSFKIFLLVSLAITSTTYYFWNVILFLISGAITSRE